MEWCQQIKATTLSKTAMEKSCPGSACKYQLIGQTSPFTTRSLSTSHCAPRLCKLTCASLQSSLPLNGAPSPPPSPPVLLLPYSEMGRFLRMITRIMGISLWIRMPQGHTLLSSHSVRRTVVYMSSEMQRETLYPHIS